MCRATTVDDVPHGAAFLLRTGAAARLNIRAFYLRLSCPPAAAPAELSLVYLPAIGGAALGLNGRALPPSAPAEARLRRIAAGDAAYASADRVAAVEGARFEVYAGKERAAEGVFTQQRPGGGWRVECTRAAPHAPAAVAEVVVLVEGGAVMRGKARPSRRWGVGCGATRLEGIPEEATDLAWGCECGEDWEVVGDDDDGGGEEELEVETVRWAMEMGVWAVCLGVGLLATASRFRRKRAFW